MRDCQKLFVVVMVDLQAYEGDENVREGRTELVEAQRFFTKPSNLLIY